MSCYLQSRDILMLLLHHLKPFLHQYFEKRAQTLLKTLIMHLLSTFYVVLFTKQRYPDIALALLKLFLYKYLKKELEVC